jgi:hypothetical protein
MELLRYMNPAAPRRGSRGPRAHVVLRLPGGASA